MIVSGVAGRIAGGGGEPISNADRSILDRLAPQSARPQLLAPGLIAVAVRGSVKTDDQIHCGVAGRLNWLDYGLAEIQDRHGQTEALLAAYRQRGIGLLSRVGGSFALFLWDQRKGTGCIAVDRFGRMPLYWTTNTAGDLLFAPTTTTVKSMSGLPHALSDQAIFHYLYFHMVPGPDSVFKGIEKLPAAHALVFSKGRWKPRRYWEPEFREHADTSFDQAATEMLGLLANSVAHLAKGADTGAFLSGGLDSSTVAGLLARHRPHPKTYSIGFDVPGYDEIPYARLASQHFKTDLRTYYVTPDDVLDAIPQIVHAYDEPFGNSSALPVYFCARCAAADGRTRLLAGDGGDELFAGNERYARQVVFERYSMLPRVLRRWLAEPFLFSRMSGRGRLSNKARSYVQQAKVPLPDRLQTYNFLHQFGLPQSLCAEFMQRIDIDGPLVLDRELYRQPSHASTLNRMLYLDWHHTLAENDLRKVTRMCELAGIEVAYPMLDDLLVDFSTRVSSRRKMQQNQLRDFFRRAVADFLPKAIIQKSKHGFGLPFGVWLAEHPGLQSLAMDNLQRMKRRKYLRADFIDEIVRRHREQHASYYGEYIWVLTMLELWLSAQGIEP